MAERLREGAYSGGSQMGADWAAANRGERPAPADDDEDQGADEAPADEDQGDEDQGADDDEDQGADEAPARSSSGVGQEGAGWVLGLLLWGWVVLPFLKGGPAGVGKVWRAKFLNQAPDGSEMP